MLKLPVLALLLALWSGCGVAIKFPIVMVPGIAGSQIYVRHTEKIPYPEACRLVFSSDDWRQAWLSFKYILPDLAHCLSIDMTLEFDVNTLKYNEPEGIETRIPNFGSTKSIEYLDNSTNFAVKEITKYFHDIVQYFVDNAGYERDESIVAAPYDWRKSPWSMDGYFERLQALVENVTAKYNAPAIVISHSMGGPVLKAFFNTTTSDWRDKHIKAWFPVEGVWIGSPKVLKAIVSGDNFGTPAPVTDLIDMERTLESTLFLAPMPGLWPQNVSDELIIVDDTRKTYGVSDYLELLQALNMSNAQERLTSVMTKRQTIHGPPGVRMYCIYATNVDTAWGYKYSALDRSGPEKDIIGDGDGTVPLPSLEFCRNWVGKQPQPVVLKTFPNVNHVGAIMDADIFKYIHAEMDSLAEEHTSRA
ncbi:phospholipase A2 group XV-like [Sycon ciliatum]|uniref:phospholipase A2 group XV-like n=1 Tax=Sycon ciliatum TaxID=27933 RepID=UPI0031F6E69C